MQRYVYGSESIATRVLTDSFFQSDVLKRKGPENFVKDMKERILRRLTFKWVRTNAYAFLRIA